MKWENFYWIISFKIFVSLIFGFDFNSTLKIMNWNFLTYEGVENTKDNIFFWCGVFKFYNKKYGGCLNQYWKAWEAIKRLALYFNKKARLNFQNSPV
jgi:hypothetical protein